MIIRKAKEYDFKAISKLLLKMFDEFIKSYFTEKGAEIFKTHRLSEESLIKRPEHIKYLAEEDSKVIGYIESDENDIWLFFVDKKYQGKGIGKALMKKLETTLKKLGHKAIYVPASPQASPIYSSLGFKNTTGERVKKGGRYQPMKKIIN